MSRSIFVGYDPREAEAFAVCRHSLRRHMPNVPVHAVVLDEVRAAGLYRRPTSIRDGRMWDDISEAPCSTQFAVSRFLTPILAKTRLALFMDCDVMARASLADLFAQAEADSSKAIWCVQHQHEPPPGIKMDGQQQTRYARKNWSSVVLWNCEHKANGALTVEMINRVPGRDLHRFSWLKDDEIGSLHPSYNYLVGHTKLADGSEPRLVHFTEGGPWLDAYRDVEFADEYRAMRTRWLQSTHTGRKANGAFRHEHARV
jgi:hypothetical protein